MIVRGSVFSMTLEMETGLTLVTPQGRRQEPYPVVYLLHGLCGGNGDWVNYTMLPTYAQEYEVVFVMPEAARSFYTDMAYGQAFFQYISEELPLIIQDQLRISGKREETAVMGASMGGYGALKCALSKPEQYGYCAAFSAACLDLREYLNRQRTTERKDLQAMYGKQTVMDFEAAFGPELQWEAKNDLMEVAKQALKQQNTPELYLACGTEDWFYEENRRFCQKMQAAGWSLRYEEWSGEHNWYFFNEALRRALGACFSPNL